MNLGVVPYLDPHGGGTYQHTLAFMEALARRADRGVDNFTVFLRDASDRDRVPRTWTTQMLSPAAGFRHALRRLGGSWGRRVWRELRPARGTPVAPETIRDDEAARARLLAAGIELMLYPTVDPLSFEAGLPYVMTVHDLQFKLQPHWPEFADVSNHWDYLLRFGVRWATLLIVDSEVGREDVLQLYDGQITADRVKVLPYLPAVDLSHVPLPKDVTRVRNTYDLPERYLFYPAQFWPHKNHARIVKAIAVLRDRHNLTAPIALAGTWTGGVRARTHEDVMALASQLGVASLVHCLGYVPDEDLAALYAGAVALVMPTFFGPTNIPVLEAWSLRCPVLTSGIRGIREQVGEAAILVDPTDIESIAEGIRRLWTEDALRRTLVQRGRERIAVYPPQEFRRRFDAIVDEAVDRVRSGDAPRRV